MNKRFVPGKVCIGFFAALLAIGSASVTQAKDQKVLFIQQDKIVAFDPGTGQGAQTGTATGTINGATIVNFLFTITTFPAFATNNRAGITDLDRDQIIFRKEATGVFLVPALAEPTLGGNPGAVPFQPFGNGLGGPMTGTYEVVATSGKYVSMFPVGLILPYRAVLYNPSAPPTPPRNVGSVYVEVYEHAKK